jgi:glycosyltransferase involved in cell wall biosynthesis
VALDFWDSLLDHGRYVLVYRHPWEVADSMQRLGADVFLLRPDYAYRIWAFYNRHLLDFHRRHRERCLLVSTDACVREPARLLDLLATRLGLDGSRLRLDDLVDAELFQSQEEDDPLIPLAAAAHPECAALLAELDRAADLSSSGLWSAEPPRARSTDAVATRLSVIIPCYDQGEFLLEAVASVERSVPEVCELIVVNDGSREPRTLEVLALLREAGYRVVDQENAGLAAARNCGIELARGPYILPLDADNRLRPGFIPAALELLDASPEVGVVYGDRFDFGLRNGTVDVPPFDLDGLLPFNYIDACALLRKEVWSACGGYDPAMLIWEDWEFWIGAAERGWQFHHLPGEAFDYRVRPHSMLSAVADEELRRRLYSYVIAKHRDLYWQRLPELLIAAQHSAADLFRLAREHERTQAEAGATFQEQAARMESSEVERISLKREIAALRAEHERTRVEGEAQAARLKSLEGEAGVLLGEREQLYAELRAWSERVLFMEGTRAWRLRQRLVDLKRALGRHFSAGSLQKQ